MESKRRGEETAHHLPAKSGAHLLPAKSGAHRLPAKSGAHHLPAKSGAHRLPAKSGAHHLPAKSRAHLLPSKSLAHHVGDSAAAGPLAAKSGARRLPAKSGAHPVSATDVRLSFKSGAHHLGVQSGGAAHKRASADGSGKPEVAAGEAVPKEAEENFVRVIKDVSGLRAKMAVRVRVFMGEARERLEAGQLAGSVLILWHPRLNVKHTAATALNPRDAVPSHFPRDPNLPLIFFHPAVRSALRAGGVGNHVLVYIRVRCDNAGRGGTLQQKSSGSLFAPAGVGVADAGRTTKRFRMSGHGSVSEASDWVSPAAAARFHTAAGGLIYQLMGDKAEVRSPPSAH